LLSATQLIAQTTQETEANVNVDAARSTVQANAREIDINDDGLISRQELLAAAAQAFPLYDADQSEDIDVNEFRESLFGFADMARVRDRQQAFDAAFGLVFDLFDREGDRRLSQQDLLDAVDRAFSYADHDSDNALSSPFPKVVMRHAHRPHAQFGPQHGRALGRSQFPTDFDRSFAVGALPVKNLWERWVNLSRVTSSKVLA